MPYHSTGGKTFERILKNILLFWQIVLQIGKIFYIFAENFYKKMVIINRKILSDFTRKHSDAVRPVKKWLSEVEEAQWSSFADVKKMYRTADYVGNDHIVFDIKGNTYRIITIVIFADGVVNTCTVYEVRGIRWAGTHAEYDKIGDCSII